MKGVKIPEHLQLVMEIDEGQVLERVLHDVVEDKANFGLNEREEEVLNDLHEILEQELSE